MGWPLRVGMALAVVGGPVAADPKPTFEVAVGLGVGFDTSTENNYTQTSPSVHVQHGRGPILDVGVGIGAFVTERVAVLAYGSCGAPLGCFAGPTAQVWLSDRVWVSGGVGLGWDPSCTGRFQSCGVDQCWCDTGTDGTDLRIALLSSQRFGGAGMVLEWMRVGTLSHAGNANTIALEFAYQWH